MVYSDFVVFLLYWFCFPRGLVAFWYRHIVFSVWDVSCSGTLFEIGCGSSSWCFLDFCQMVFPPELCLRWKNWLVRSWFWAAFTRIRMLLLWRLVRVHVWCPSPVTVFLSGWLGGCCVDNGWCVTTAKNYPVDMPWCVFGLSRYLILVLRRWCYWSTKVTVVAFDKPGRGIEKLVNNVADVIYGMLSLAYLFLLHLLGWLLLIFICYWDLCWFQILFMRCAVLFSWCVHIFVIFSWLLSWWVVMNIFMIGLLSFLDVDEVSVPLIHWIRGMLSGWQ